MTPLKEYFLWTFAAAVLLYSFYSIYADSRMVIKMEVPQCIEICANTWMGTHPTDDLGAVAMVCAKQFKKGCFLKP